MVGLLMRAGQRIEEGRSCQSKFLPAMAQYAFNTLGVVRHYAPCFEWNRASGRRRQGRCCHQNLS